MRYFIFVILLYFSTFVLAQKNDSLNKHSVGIDITGLLGTNYSGLRYQYEMKNIQLRSTFSYRYYVSNTPTDSMTLTTKTSSFTPKLGIAWNKKHNKFSFFAGSDFYYIFNKNSYNYNFPILYNRRIYGFEPIIGFRFPLHEYFFLQLEGRSQGDFNEIKNIQKNTTQTNFNFTLMNQYSIFLIYQF